MMLHRISKELIEKTLEDARRSPRKRGHHSFSTPDDTTQRMINGRLSGAYLPPHKHNDPNKCEILIALKGQSAVLIFDDQGHIIDSTIIEPGSDIQAAEVPPLHWHTLVGISDESVVYEIAGGKYDATTHKTFPSWAPGENEEKSAEYLESLKKRAIEFHESKAKVSAVK